MRINKLLATIGLAVLVTGAVATAQTMKSLDMEDIKVQAKGPLDLRVIGSGMGMQANANAFFFGVQAGIEGKVVKNAPYSADGITEITRVLADGTKISRKTTSKFYRDSKGRTRREQTLGAIGPWSPEGEPPKTITINNPVEGELYILNPKDKTARKLEIETDTDIPSEELKRMKVTAGDHASEFSWQHTVVVKKEIDEEVRTHTQAHDITVPIKVFEESDVKEESLGERNIEGVMAQGTRITTTIPAGEIGNDQPITSVRERWYSPELQAVVLSETKDPMSENSVYRLTNILRGDPPASVFWLPSDYTIKEEGSLKRKIQLVEVEESEDQLQETK